VPRAAFHASSGGAGPPAEEAATGKEKAMKTKRNDTMIAVTVWLDADGLPGAPESGVIPGHAWSR
jgi:hypothetical protein